LVDIKWAHFYAEVLPQAQALVAHLVRAPDPKQVCFAPNTHELVVRLLSALDWRRPQRVLCSAHEFHSFARQLRRLEETGQVRVTRVAAEPYADFAERFKAAATATAPDLVFVSQVLFDSGFVVTGLEEIAAQLPGECLFVVDGYHAFCALPVDWSKLAGRAFYLAGGYKYAQAGEGACFLIAPPQLALRPLITGWFANFAELDGPQTAAVTYAADGQRYAGATFDASGIYRLLAVWRQFEELGIAPEHIHAHVAALQARFLAAAADWSWVKGGVWHPPHGIERGNFLTLAHPQAPALQARLAAAGVTVDRRGERLRFGFGVYQDQPFIDAVIARLAQL
jgi:selenocysteine lyase/cysteine desulfurase